MIPLKIKRLIVEGYRDVRDFGLKVGFARLRCILHDESLASVQHKNRVILQKLRVDYESLLQVYQMRRESTVAEDKAPIWMFWWEGELPDILKLCYYSRTKHAGDHPIILLTKGNIHEYISFPDCVWQQFQNGKLRIQHLADMIRVQLLRNYGGLWLDASIYCNKDIPECIYAMPLFSIKGDRDPRFVSNNQWTTFAIGGYKNNVLCSFLDDFFQEYCKRGNRFIDYYMFDCAIALAYEHIPAVKASIDSIPYMPGDCYLLDRSLEKTEEELQLPLFSKIGWSRFRDIEPRPDSLYSRLLRKEGICEH